MNAKNPSVIPEHVVDEATRLLNNTLALLKPYLLALTPSERMVMAKMSDRTYPFVEKTLDYTHTSVQFIPPYMNQNELSVDFKSYEQFNGLLRLVVQLQNGLDDSTMHLGGQCYTNALNYYNSVKQASKMNVPGAKAIYEDLSKRFAKGRSDKEELSEEFPEIN